MTDNAQARPRRVVGGGSSWALECHEGTWSVMHRATELRIAVWRPYPGHESFLPPIQVANFGSRKEAEAAAAEIDWNEVDRHAAAAEVQAQASAWREKRDFEIAYQVALKRARADLEPWPWQPGGLLHRAPEAPAADDTQLDLGLAA